MSTVYLDNAATTHPKPESVYLANNEFLRQGGSPGRSAHHLSLSAAREVFNSRLSLASLLGITSPERVIFTSGCTASINTVLKGRTWRAGDTVLVSALEHNAVMRPLSQIEKDFGVTIRTIPYRSSVVVDSLEFKQLVQETKPSLCIVSEASNVTGELVDLDNIEQVCGNAGVELMVDAAQSAGVFHRNLTGSSIAYWCASGHKGLLGAPGVGVLYVRPDLHLRPLIEGGTGSRSEDSLMPESYPDHLEAGTLPAPAIAALGAGVQWLLEQDRIALREKELKLAAQLIAGIQSLPGAKVIAADVMRRTGVVSFSITGMDSGDISDILDRDFGICVRSGLHCSPSAHRALGTLQGGLVRASFGHFNTLADVEFLVSALEKVVTARV